MEFQVLKQMDLIYLVLYKLCDFQNNMFYKKVQYFYNVIHIDIMDIQCQIQDKLIEIQMKYKIIEKIKIVLNMYKK